MVWADSTDADFTSTGTDQFLIRASGGVGVGTGDPDGATLRVHGNSTLGDIWLSPTTAGGNADVFFSETVSGSFGIKLRHNGASNGFEFVGVNSSVETAPLVTIGRGSSSGVTIANNLAVGGDVTANAFVTSSDRNLKENFQPVTPLQVLEKVVGLPISQWNFKTDADATHVGPMAQDFRAAFGLGTDERHIATVDADGVALAAIQGLNQKVESGKQKAERRIKRLETENAFLRHEIREVKALLSQLTAKDKAP